MNKLLFLSSLGVLSAALVACGGGNSGGNSSEPASSSSAQSSSVPQSSSVASSSSSAPVIDFEVTSPRFNANDWLGDAYSCEGGTAIFDGKDIMPEINWTQGPAGTQSYAVTFKDMTIISSGIDIQYGYHWAMWNIPANVTQLPEAMPGGNGGISGASQMSPYGDGKFAGPCPNHDICTTGASRKTDEYEFHVYAMPSANINPGNSVQNIDNWLINNALEVTTIRVHSDAAPACGPSLSGQQLFQDNCSFCHVANGSAGSGTDKTGRSASQIQNAINSVGQMAGFRAGSNNELSQEEIQAIADWL